MLSQELHRKSIGHLAPKRSLKFGRCWGMEKSLKLRALSSLGAATGARCLHSLRRIGFEEPSTGVARLTGIFNRNGRRRRSAPASTCLIYLLHAHLYIG